MVTSTEATLRPRMFQTMGSGLEPPQIRAQRRANLANEIDLAVASGTALPTPSCVWFRIQYSEELVAEQLARNYAFLIASRHAGARSGVAHLRLIDFDYVTLSSLNRRSTRRVVRGGADGVEMTQSAPCSSSTVELLQGADWVVVELLADCVQNNIKVHGSWHKVGPDPHTNRRLIRAVCQSLRAVRSRSERSSPPTPTMTFICTLRYLLRAQIFNPGGILIRGSVDELAPLRDFRVCVLPVLLPAAFEELGVAPPHDYDDALGEPIDPAWFDNGIIISSSEEVWGVEAARVAQFRIAQARRFRKWAFH
ncbi:hypothetical protein BGW80DRAFT_1565569 [Lactifluus volemus]|nr:hypothetical protein BGW80DRAFT_1565569 [Lactifluus volemus]